MKGWKPGEKPEKGAFSGLMYDLIIQLIQNRFQSMLAGYLEWPNVQEWLLTFVLLMLFSIVALRVGLSSGLLREEATTLRTSQRLLLALRLLIHPALTEETIFRGLLLPAANGKSLSMAAWLSLSVLLFVLIHPLNARILRPEKQELFTNPTFLLLAAFLGIATSALYWFTGSLWPAVTFHWFVVFVTATKYTSHDDRDQET